VGYNLFRKTGRVTAGFLKSIMRESVSEMPLFADLVERGFPRGYAESLLDGSKPSGDAVGFLAYAVTSPAASGINLSARTLQATQGYMRDQLGLEYAFAFGRITQQPGVSGDYRTACAQLNEYLKSKRGDELNPDWAVRFHQRAGGRIVAGVPYSTEKEHGFLVAYHLKKPRTE